MAQHRFVERIPDLISPEEYEADAEGKRVKFEIRWTDAGLEILGDAPRARELEQLLEGLDPAEIEQMLCG